MRVRSFGAVLMVLSVAGCDVVEEIFEQLVVHDLRTTTSTEQTSNDASAWFNVKVEEGETSMLLTATPGSGQYHVYFDELYDPDGKLVLDGDEAFYSFETLTYGIWPDAVTSLNWPILNIHPELKQGRWQVKVTSLDADSWSYKGGVDVKLRSQFSKDPSFDSGEVIVNVIYTGGTEDDPEVVDAVEYALSHWKDIYAQAGLTVVFEETVYQKNINLEPPSYGSGDEYTELSKEADLGVLSLVLVPEFTGAGGAWTLGLAGGIPGPLVSTDYSAVAVNVTAHMGNNLQFSDQDKRIFAETMAHEIGHYMGLFHPVEDDWQTVDALADTPDCTSESSCESQLASNLMYYITVCDGATCEPQDTLTDDQAGVMNRYVGSY